MVLVVQLRGPHAQHVAVVMSEQLPQAAHVLVLGLVSVLVCEGQGEVVGNGTEGQVPMGGSGLARDSLSPRKGSHTPLLASWYLRLAWALSRARTRYWLFSFSMSWLWAWGETRGQRGLTGPWGPEEFSLR